MIKLYDSGVYVVRGKEIVEDGPRATAAIEKLTGQVTDKVQAKKATIASRIIDAHNKKGDEQNLRIVFDALTGHDLTYVNIIQTARASGMTSFPMPFILTNCHNSLGAVGGTINEDDHKFALSAVKKYGGIYVPPHLAVIHAYNREMTAGCGKMVLGSDSHTRYGALGTMAVGEGGGESAKQLVGRTYDLARPEVIAVYLTGKPQKGVGPHDVALSLIGATYKNGYVNNKALEFIGDGVEGLSVEFRNAVDVMTTETTCWSSIWKTDDKVREYLEVHGRPQDYKQLEPGEVAYYDGMIYVDLSKVEPTIALPFNPSNTYTIRELRQNAREILAHTESECMKQLGYKNLNMRLTEKVKGGEVFIDQGIIGGCAGGTFDGICDAADILEGKTIGNGTFSLNVYPGSQPAYIELVRNGTVAKLMAAGVTIRSAFCGPCFGACDTPANGEFSIRHTTRNFPNREGSKPGEGQIASVALMDALSIAASAANGGMLTPATDIDANFSKPKYFFDKSIYQGRVLDSVGQADPTVELQYGPNIKDWPPFPALTDHLLLKVVTYITDPVTTTDEIVPSGEISSFRSNPHRLAEYAFYRKDPDYVGKAKQVREVETLRGQGGDPRKAKEVDDAWMSVHSIVGLSGLDPKAVGVGSVAYAHRPGDGSAREQAATVQRVLGGWANICLEYATKRYRSNLINWGMIPFQIDDASSFGNGSWLFVPNAKQTVLQGLSECEAWVLGDTPKKITLKLAPLTEEERRIIAAGSLINYYREGEF